MCRAYVITLLGPILCIAAHWKGPLYKQVCQGYCVKHPHVHRCMPKCGKFAFGISYCACKCFTHPPQCTTMYSQFLMHLNRWLYVALVGPGNAITQALHAVWPLYDHAHEAFLCSIFFSCLSIYKCLLFFHRRFIIFTVKCYYVPFFSPYLAFVTCLVRSFLMVFPGWNQTSVKIEWKVF